jgi:hypothetical protein
MSLTSLQELKIYRVHFYRQGVEFRQVKSNEYNQAPRVRGDAVAWGTALQAIR